MPYPLLSMAVSGSPPIGAPLALPERCPEKMNAKLLPVLIAALWLKRHMHRPTECLDKSFNT